MHIPDGYLSPQTYVPAYVAMIPVWARAQARLQRTLRARQVPLLAVAAAFSFLIMMFNVPVPGGSSGHAVGAVLIAILLGPWAAVVAVSLALVVQALLFGDGGVTAIGANCLNMAVIMPFAGYWTYRAVAGSAPAASRRHALGAALGGYVGLNAAALAAGIMFGLQPLIAHDAAGRPLYCPYGLRVSLAAMAGGHLLLFGVVEAVVTGMVVAYLQRTSPELLPAASAGRPGRRAVSRLAWGVAVLALLSPLGLYLPARLGAGSAWGEWSAEEIGKLVGHVPAGLQRLGGAWHAPLPDYALKGQEQAPLSTLMLSYVLSAVVGVLLLCALVLLLHRLWSRKETPDAPGTGGSPPASGPPADAPRAHGPIVLPGWMAPRADPEGWDAPAGGSGPVRVARGRVLRGSLRGLGKLLADVVGEGQGTAGAGLLQAVDARAKVVGLLALLVVATLVHRPAALLAAYGFCLLLAAASRVPARRLLAVWVVVPLFSGAIMLPATLNVVAPGRPIWVLWHGPLGPWRLPEGLAVTDTGLFLAGRFVLRTALCVTLAVLLSSTTRPARLFRGLRALGVPRLFVMLLAMMVRYLDVMARAAAEIHLAKLSRSVAQRTLREEQAWVAAGIGSLFRRTRALGDAVTLAMLSRGYRGEAHLLEDPRWRRLDWAFLGAAAAAAALLLRLG